MGLIAAGCTQIEQLDPERPVEEEFLIHKTFYAETEGTRTTLDGVDVYFSEGEAISIWDGTGNRKYTADESGRNVSFSGDVAETATEFFALAPYSESTVFARNGSMVTAATTLASAQEATAGTFADGANISAAQSTSDDSFGLKNVLAVAKFTLASANLNGHQIASVELTSTHPLAGDVIVTYGDVPTAEAGANTVKTVSLSHSDGTALADGTYYLTLLPNDGGQITLKFTATDGYTATKTATLKSAFEAGTIKNLGTVKGLEWEEPKYVKVTSETNDWTGDYLLVYETGKLLLGGVAVVNNKTSVGTVVDNLSIASDNTISWESYKNYNVSIEKSGTGYSLYLNGAGYLGWNSGNSLVSGTAVSSDNYRWTLSMDTEGNVLIKNMADQTRTIWCNPNANRFCAYTGLGDYVKAIQLYRKVAGEASAPAPEVITKPATDITVSSAILNAAFANLGTTNVQDVHFVWGESESEMSHILGAEDFDVTTGTFQATLSSLGENKTYYFKAVLQYCTDGVNYQVLEGLPMSFKTDASQSGGGAGLQWLGCYEIPAIDLENQESCSGSGKETFGSTKWYNYLTNNPMQKVITHTYAYNNKTYRNFTTLIDGDKRCPLWTAYVMHKVAYPDNDAGRGSFNENTSYDPGIPREWQSSGSTSDYNNGNGYSRGHHIASEDRQVNDDANDQTFYYTNQSPQWQNSFNGGIWNSLEGAIQNNAPSGRDTLYVVVGTLFENGNTGPSNDGGTVARPSHYYKLVMKCFFNTSGEMTDAKGVAFLYTNEAHSGKYYDAGYRTTINAIEQRSGFTFFVNVPAEYREPAKQTSALFW